MSTMKVVASGSSSIEYFEYDFTKSILTVGFTGKSEYTYADVPESVFDGLCAAESKGKYFAAHIKNKYVTEKLPGMSINPPIWVFPTGAKPDMTHGSDVPAAWPFPTGKRPE